jgi:hypothetical protein
MWQKCKRLSWKTDNGTIHDVCNIVGLLYGMCQRILSDELSLQRIASKFVLMLLSIDQEYCIALSTELKEQTEKTQLYLYHHYW